MKVKLIGTKCNRTAIGARVKVVTGKHAQIDEVHTGTSVMSQSDLRLHFGVGKAAKVDLIEVRWPTLDKSIQAGGPPKPGSSGKGADGPVEHFTNVDCNQILTIKEGAGIIKAEKVRS